MLAVVFSGSFLLAYILHKRVAWLIALVIFAGLLPMNLAMYYLVSSAQRRVLRAAALRFSFGLLVWVTSSGPVRDTTRTYMKFGSTEARGEEHTVKEWERR